MNITPPGVPGSQNLVWVDAHCHLQDPRLAHHLPEVLARARNAGVALLHIAATTQRDWDAVRALAETHPGRILCSFGLHPWWIGERTSGWRRQLRDLLRDHPAGIGEIGLDGRMEDGLDADREAVFREQLDLSCELARPASVHCRDAWCPMLDLLLARPPHPAGLLIHAYSGPADALGDLAGKNIYVSFGGTLTRPANRRARENAARARDGFFLIESDAPDLPPTLPDGDAPRFSDENRKPLSEPAHIPWTAEHLARARGTTVSAIAAQTTAAARRLFAPLIC